MKRVHPTDSEAVILIITNSPKLGQILVSCALEAAINFLRQKCIGDDPWCYCSIKVNGVKVNAIYLKFQNSCTIKERA